MSYLIYAAYGSNLLKKRFMVYIKGGNFRNNAYKGSKDKSEPEDWGWTRVPYRLYFAKSSSLWDNKGVAFLSTKNEVNPEMFAVVRLWKISYQQFKDIQMQEGSWYLYTLHLGCIGGLPILTITSENELTHNLPSDNYL